MPIRIFTEATLETGIDRVMDSTSVETMNRFTEEHGGQIKNLEQVNLY